MAAKRRRLCVAITLLVRQQYTLRTQHMTNSDTHSQGAVSLVVFRVVLVVDAILWVLGFFECLSQ